MIGYLGVPGAMVRLPYRGGLDTSSDRPVSFTRTLGGKRKAFVGARARREWSVSFDLVGSREVSGLVEIARSSGQVLWYPADATAGNLFSPQAAGWEVVPWNATETGLVALPDGSVARTVVPNAGPSGVLVPGNVNGTSENVPVRPGVPVSVGGWGFSGIRFTGSWYDSAGAVLSSINTAAFTFSGWGWRSRTVLPPAGAASVSLNLSQGTQYARPSVAWGDVGHDGPGRGCPRAVVHGLSEALAVITRDDAYGSIDVTITEVG